MLTQTDSLTRLRAAIAPYRLRLEKHALYREIRTIEQLRVFVESHVFAVWDFMSLLKALQAQLTCVTIPWVPSAYPQSRRLINEIVLGEESDTFGQESLSHFELYLRAMQQAGADTGAILNLIECLKRGDGLDAALLQSHLPLEAFVFVRSTFALIYENKPHVTAAAFTFGREDLIPDMFHQMVRDLRQNLETVELFEYYLDRHIEVDGDSHGPLALRMMEELCGDDERKWEEAIHAAQSALSARLDLWDSILSRLRMQ